VVAQPAGGRAVAAGAVSLLAVEHFHPPHALRLGAVDEAANALDVGAQPARRHRADVLLRKQRQTLREVLHRRPHTFVRF